jgi:flagellar hook-length control protein FliK
MLPIAAVQSSGLDSLNAAAGAGGDVLASGFIALFARSMSGQLATADKTAPLPVSDSEQTSRADPTALELLQSLAIPALLAGVNPPTAAVTAQGASGNPVGVELNLDTRKKLPLDPATLAAGKDLAPSGTTDDSASTELPGDFQNVLKLGTAPSRTDFVADLGTASDKRMLAPAVDTQSTTPMQYQMVAAAHAGASDTIASAQAKPWLMQTAFAAPGWQQELGDKVVWMAGNQRHVSELVLNPPNMGTVEVRLHVTGVEAGAQFYAANPDVRHAIEQALPRLREMMADAGIALGQAMVSNQSFSQRDTASQQSGRDGTAAGMDSGTDSIGAVAAERTWIGNGLLDSYA